MDPGTIKKVVLITCFILQFLSGCDFVERLAATITQPAQPYQTVSSLLTRTAVGLITQNKQTIVKSTDKITPVIVKSSPGAALSPTFSPDCNRASAGIPLDLTIPDNSVIPAGSQFSKTWRLMNNGTCPWTRGYAAVWFSGEKLSDKTEVYLNRQVEVGKTIDITVDFIAPGKPGVYQSNWKLRSPAGDLFGIGPEGMSPFWVKIIVLAGEEKTPTAPLPSPTPTVAAYNLATTTLYLRNSIDLENGVINPLVGYDLRIVVDTKSGILLSPENGAKIGIFGTQEPSFPDCQLAFINPDAIILNAEKENVYYCYRTDQGLPGRFVFKRIDTNRGIFQLDYLTWYLP